MTAYTLYILILVLLMWIAGWNLRAVEKRQAVLLLASYLFYSSWGIGFLSILILSSLVNFTIGWVLRRRLSAGYLWLGLALNIAILALFKYLPPILERGASRQCRATEK